VIYTSEPEFGAAEVPDADGRMDVFGEAIRRQLDLRSTCSTRSPKTPALQECPERWAPNGFLFSTRRLAIRLAVACPA
jgi:hypothetical protein